MIVVLTGFTVIKNGNLPPARMVFVLRPGREQTMQFVVALLSTDCMLGLCHNYYNRLMYGYVECMCILSHYKVDLEVERSVNNRNCTPP